MRTRFFPLLAVLCLFVAACGETSANNVASLEATDETEATDDVAGLDGEAGVDAEEAMLEFAQCLRDAGFEVEDPEVDSDGNIRPPRPSGEPGEIDREAARAAADECSHLLEGVTLGFGDIDQTELEDQFVEFAACLRDQGLDVDDPDFSEGGFGGRTILGDLDRDDPDVEAALEACDDILADFGFRGPGPGGR